MSSSNENSLGTDKIIRGIVNQLRVSSDLPAILNFAIEELTKLCRADRGLVWQLVDDQLAVTNEFAQYEHYCFKGAILGPQETTAMISDFLSRGLNDDLLETVVAIKDSKHDEELARWVPTLDSLIQSGNIQARLVAHLRSRGTLFGFVELQQAGPREWRACDEDALQRVSELLAVVAQQSFDLVRMEQDANEMKLVSEIFCIFRESVGQRIQPTIEHSIGLVSKRTGFACAQLFLFSDEESALVPQTKEEEHSESISLLSKSNPFVQVFEKPKLKLINLEFSKREDAFFGHDTAMIIPLMSQGEKLGVLGLWKRTKATPTLRLREKELALAVAPHLASLIRAERMSCSQLRPK